MIVSAVHFDGHKGWTMVKRFKIENDAVFNKFSYITDHPDSSILYVTADAMPIVNYDVKVRNNWVNDTLNLAEFIDIKGWKAVGNRLSSERLRNFTTAPKPEVKPSDNEQHNVGDTIEFDIETGQTFLF